MGAKYLPTIKDQKAIQRFQQNQKRKVPIPAKKPTSSPAQPPPKHK